MIEWLLNGAFHILLTVIPTWVWVVVAGLAIGWAWKTFGWQGVAGAAIAILSLGSYRQGWRDRGDGKQPIVPVGTVTRPKRSLTTDEIKALQSALNARGFDAGPVDGKPGRKTREAIQQFQASRGETATGTPTTAQMKALGVL